MLRLWKYVSFINENINVRNENIFDVSEVAEILDLSISRVEQLIREGKLKSVNGYIREIDLYKYIRNRYGIRWLIYARVSDKKDKSLDEQVEKCRQYIMKVSDKFSIVGTIKHTCQYDLTDIHRWRLVEFILNRKVDAIIAHDVTRFTRDAYAFLLLWMLCKQNNVEIHTVKEGFIDEDRLEGVLLNLEESFW